MSLSKLEGLQPGMRAVVEYWLQVLRQLGYDPVVVEGYRDPKEQARLYAIGRTADEVRRQVKKQGRDGAVTDAPPGASPHQYGLAVDIEDRHGRTGDLHALASQVGWGTVSWDPPHLEWPNWRQFV